MHLFPLFVLVMPSRSGWRSSFERSHRGPLLDRPDGGRSDSQVTGEAVDPEIARMIPVLIAFAFVVLIDRRR